MPVYTNRRPGAARSAGQRQGSSAAIVLAVAGIWHSIRIRSRHSRIIAATLIACPSDRHGWRRLQSHVPGWRVLRVHCLTAGSIARQPRRCKWHTLVHSKAGNNKLRTGTSISKHNSRPRAKITGRCSRRKAVCCSTRSTASAAAP